MRVVTFALVPNAFGTLPLSYSRQETLIIQDSKYKAFSGILSTLFFNFL